MSKYDGEMLKEIDDRADLIEYVSQTMELEQKGDNLWAHCSKHVDETPSLSFSIKDGFYHCFSCGRSGRMIWWLYDYEGLSFDDAVAKAARLANMDISKMCQSDTVIYLKKLKKMTAKTSIKYQHPILSSSELDKYQQEQIPEWLDEGIEQNVMDLFGVRVDTWQNRIVYPVYDIDGNLINIKGRTRYLNYKQLRLSKYMNYFKVGCMDYFQGLNFTLTYVEQQNEIIIFESVKSVMKAYGWGYKNCASAETHDLSDEQMALILSLKVNVVFAWDTDVSYLTGDTKKQIDTLKRITNVYIIQDPQQLLGGKESKNAPVDCGREVWEELYANKRKVV